MKILRSISIFGAVAAAAIVIPARRTPIYAADATAASGPGSQVYQQKCAVCHGETMQGIPPYFPSLVGVGHRMNSQQVGDLVHHGRGRMPAFSATQLSNTELASLLHYLATDRTFTTLPAGAAAGGITNAAATFDSGGSIYQQNCAFCHGRDTAGGESGPDLTRSKLVAEDVKGDKIGVVVRNGRPDNKMPKFNFSEVELQDLVKFIHAQAALAASHPGGRRGVDVADLQTGNVEAGKQYFYGAGGCSKCHSPTGDLAGIASRYQGLQLEERMLYPRDAKDKVTVTLPSGETIVGTVEYQDEFTIGMRDAHGTYRSWPVAGLNYKIDSPVTAHVDQFPKYTDDDIHNLMAFIQTLKSPDASTPATATTHGDD